jgi:hypothetical protein
MIVTLVARNANNAMVESGRVCVCWESAVKFCVGALAGLWDVTTNMFSHSIKFIKGIL